MAITKKSLSWTVYILKCADGTFYTGITSNLSERLAKHNNGTGAKYTKGRGPVRVIYTEPFHTKSCALRRETAIKRLSRNQKKKLCSALIGGSRYS